MRFCTYGNPHTPAVLLIHGMLTPLAAFEPLIRFLSSDHYVIAPVLDGHDGDPESEFISAEQQARAIEAYLTHHGHLQLHAICGFSLGGVVAFEVWKQQSVSTRCLVMDGAPLGGCNRLLTAVMTANYRSIIKRSRRRDTRTQQAFAANFLPASLWEDYTVIADTISDSSVRAILKATGTNRLRTPLPPSDTKVYYCHGTAVNELLSKRTANALKKMLSSLQTVPFNGDPHCFKAIYHPDEWYAVFRGTVF